MNIYITALLAGYLLGCFQTSYFIGKFIHRIDIREHGTTNAGASNVTMVLGMKWGILTFGMDFFKAAFAVVLIRNLVDGPEILPFLAGCGAVVGHIFPVFLGFRGGKGVASLLGAFLLFDWRIGLILAISMMIFSLVSDYIAVGSVTLYAALPGLLYYFHYSRLIIVISVALSLIGFFKHLPNILKIRRGEERGIRSVLFKKST
ncbi:MAG: glycerol-3-phosphate acyltransferase [FCB group bacterium]|nr:glycerol-3-phosphate acyltransferase [FCB group bacterium]